VANIDGDGRDDVKAGGYSKGPREEDGDLGIDDPQGWLAWFRQRESSVAEWERHHISWRKRGMFDDFVVRDMDEDRDVDFVGTRGNSIPCDGVFWLEQVRATTPNSALRLARRHESKPMPLPSDWNLSRCRHALQTRHRAAPPHRAHRADCPQCLPQTRPPRTLQGLLDPEYYQPMSLQELRVLLPGAIPRKPFLPDRPESSPEVPASPTGDTHTGTSAQGNLAS
jgi:hypothetical protein